MTDRERALARAENIIRALSRPLSRAEIKNGWNGQLQALWLQFFQRMKSDIVNQESLSTYVDYSIVRGLDAQGITEGELLELCAAAGNAVDDVLNADSEQDLQ